MVSSISTKIIGAGLGSDPTCEKYKFLERKGFTFVEAGPMQDNIRNLVKKMAVNDAKCILAINLSPVSPNLTEEEIIKDVITRFSLLYDFADSFTINADIKSSDYITILLDELLAIRICEEKSKEIYVRLNPNLPASQVERIINYCRLSQIDGVITTDYENIISMTQGRYQVIADIPDATPQTVNEAFSKGCEIVLATNWRPRFRFVKNVLK